ncbi:pyridoxamine 5'-phosphate oxidase family protein [Mycetocola sp. 2940]|uniref:pyridoxamine 5'-phosphate oxidase family protein n=1 Tax=Mycetocola sp. 2940 TaxID=3156452 RepID=UPI003397466A
MPVRELTETESLHYLAGASVGRVVVTVGDVTDIFPVTHTIIDGAVYFRTAPGEKLAGLAANAAVLFEADELEESRAWSVIVRGLARRLEHDDEIEPVLTSLRNPFARGRKDVVVRILPTSVSGRLFEPTAEDDADDTVEPTD